MAQLTIRTIPDPILSQKAAPVNEVDARIVKLMDEMLQVMYANHGIGLAANQVGLLERIVIIDVSPERDGSKALFLANPEIVWKSEETVSSREGCLSVPDQYAEIKRHARVRVGYLDRENRAQEIEAEGLLSYCLQHEIDHLDGKLFIDRLSPLKRKMLLKRLEKARCEREFSTVL